MRTTRTLMEDPAQPLSMAASALNRRNDVLLSLNDAIDASLAAPSTSALLAHSSCDVTQEAPHFVVTGAAGDVWIATNIGFVRVA